MQALPPSWSTCWWADVFGASKDQSYCLAQVCNAVTTAVPISSSLAGCCTKGRCILSSTLADKCVPVSTTTAACLAQLVHVPPGLLITLLAMQQQGHVFSPAPHSFAHCFLASPAQGTHCIAQPAGTCQCMHMLHECTYVPKPFWLHTRSPLIRPVLQAVVLPPGGG